MLMNVICGLRFFVAVATSVAVAAIPAVPGQLDSRDDCDTDSAVPFYRSWNGRAAQTSDHFYTTNYAEMDYADTSLGYAFEGAMGLVFRSPSVSAALFYRMYNPSESDHFYTTDQNEAVNAIRNDGYVDEGTAGYVYEDQICGSVPLYRMYNPGVVDHFYTTNETERENAIANDGYNDEGIACYVLPNL